MNETKVIRKKSKRKINRILTLVLLGIVLIFFGTIFYINIIPIFYTIFAFILFLGIVFGIVILNFKRKRILRIIGYTLSIILISILVFILVYLFNTLGFLFNMTDGDYSLHNYNLVVLQSSDYEDIKDLNNKNIGVSSTSTKDALDKALKKIKKEIKINKEEYEDLNSLVDALDDNIVEGIILEDSEMSLFEEENKDIYSSFKVIYEVEVKKTLEDLKSAININKEPFNIYISGIDTYGKINSSSRSDVNIVVSVNPNTEKILITWIPRDYYVDINKGDYKDKLTHAGIYGVDSSINAIEKLLDININYYVKVNFTSVIKVVDLLGGITINNEESFTTIDGTYFEKGNITLDGEKTLTFVRERKNLAEGDLGRGKHQIQVLEALFNKAMSKDIIKKYNSLLKSLDGTFVTNMSQNEMFGFIKREISNRRDWQLESNTLLGTDSYEYTYSYKNNKLYVMLPNEESINDAKNKINEIMK